MTWKNEHGNPSNCRDCRYFEALPKEREYHIDGICTNARHAVKDRKTHFYVHGGAWTCFDAEPPEAEQQITMEGFAK